MAGFAAATLGTAKPGQPQRDLAEQCCDRMIPVVLHMANSPTASAGRPSAGMAPGLRGNDLPLQTRQQQLPFGQGQPQVGDLTEIIRPVDLLDPALIILNER